MARTHVYNTTDGPIVLDDDGRIVPARSWHPTQVDTKTLRVARHIDAGRLITGRAPADVDVLTVDDFDLSPAITKEN